MEEIILFTFFTTAISTIIGLFFAITSLIFKKDFEASCIVFFFASFGGLLGGVIGSIVGYFIGIILYSNTTVSIFVIDGDRIIAIFVAGTIWILGIIIGAVLGGFRGMNTID